MSATLDHLLSPIDEWLNDPAVEEICIQEPRVAWIYARGQFTRHTVPLLAEEIEDIAIVAAAQRGQDVGLGKPLLRTDLVGRGRLMAVLPPCVAEGYPSITIRRGSDDWPTLGGLAASGLFRNTRTERRQKTKTDSLLLDLYREKRWEEFFAAAVRARKTIIGCGMTASGKTHFAKALIAEIPLEERLITIEDAPELRGIPHPNRVQMYYDKESSIVHAGLLVEAALRMRIGRLFLQEVSDGSAAVAFLVALQTGHSGGITTIHAAHCDAVFTRLRVLVKQTSGGAAISDDDVRSELRELVDIVVHSSRDDGPFEVDEVWFREAEQ